MVGVVVEVVVVVVRVVVRLGLGPLTERTNIVDTNLYFVTGFWHFYEHSNEKLRYRDILYFLLKLLA